MPVTKNYGFPLYDPDDSPDLTLTGREAVVIIAIDEALKSEENGRKAADELLTDNLANEVAERESADTALGGRIDAEAAARGEADNALGGRIDAEAAARGAADTALGGRIDTEKADRESADTAIGGRIDNAEVEISANSADITGIKGLTYGNDHVAFLENNSGEYGSPALQEIAEQIATISSGGGGGSTSNVTVSTGTGTHYTGLTVTPTSDSNGTRYDIALQAASKSQRGGVTIGSGLNVNPAGILSVDTAALPSGGITGNTTWAELEA